ncbi:hypothetical protein [Halobacillus sp. BBL2006]|uniref:hypothetical protein n=1 Tax=Halobacillus sp. BBL2006 TaxID=1543706 RepID=UPI000542946D|nr:hypothetical protein [Halobacillus sp. BBL2006]KHE72200.1 hypothetical protein LD39_05815 [Halobacillus sp. BBL2006]
MQNYKEQIECFIVSIFTLLVLFGVIFISGVVTGVDWGDYWVDFSWSMFNIEEIKQMVGVR